MEKAIVLFKNPDKNESIEITLNYNKEDSLIDYDVKLSEGYKPTDQMDLIGFLAHMFLTSLQVNNE